MYSRNLIILMGLSQHMECVKAACQINYANYFLQPVGLNRGKREKKGNRKTTREALRGGLRPNSAYMEGICVRMQIYNKSTYPIEEALIIVGPSQSGKFDVFKGVLQILPSCHFSHLKCKENCQFF